MTSSSWTASLLQSIDKNRPQPLFFNLCTLSRLDKSPRSRTVVCRKLQHSGGRILICTSTVSEKWKELRSDPRFELCWYFTESREQYRLKGDRVEFLLRVEDADADQVWQDMSDSAKQTFTKVIGDKKDPFGVLAFHPSAVELLELTSGKISTWESE